MSLVPPFSCSSDEEDGIDFSEDMSIDEHRLLLLENFHLYLSHLGIDDICKVHNFLFTNFYKADKNDL